MLVELLATSGEAVCPQAGMGINSNHTAGKTARNFVVNSAPKHLEKALHNRKSKILFTDTKKINFRQSNIGEVESRVSAGFHS